jgi:hypothetical protein
MSQKHETPNLLENLTFEEFKLQLDGKFMLNYLVFQDEMELLEVTQGNNKGFLATYVQDQSIIDYCPS